MPTAKTCTSCGAKYQIAEHLADTGLCLKCERGAGASRSGYPFLHLLILVYYIAGSLSLFGAVLLAVKDSIPFGVGLAVAGLVNFGLAEALKILLTLEKRSRP